MNDGRQAKILNISREEQEARLLSSVILEYNDESQYLARDDRENLITFGDGQGNTFPIPFPEGEKVLWKQMRRFRNLIVHGFVRFAEDGSITIRPSEEWKTPRYDADVEPFPNGLGQQVDGVYRYSLSEMRGLAGLFRGMSPLIDSRRPWTHITFVLHVVLPPRVLSDSNLVLFSNSRVATGRCTNKMVLSLVTAK